MCVQTLRIANIWSQTISNFHPLEVQIVEKLNYLIKQFKVELKLSLSYF